MLFGPEDCEQFGDPDVDRSQAVKPGVAGRADRNQEIRVTEARMPVMNVEAIPCPAVRASKVIPLENQFPVAAKVISRVPTHPIALRAEARDCRDSFAAGAKEGLLAETGPCGSPQDAFWRAGEE